VRIARDDATIASAAAAAAPRGVPKHTVIGFEILDDNRREHMKCDAQLYPEENQRVVQFTTDMHASCLREITWCYNILRFGARFRPEVWARKCFFERLAASLMEELVVRQGLRFDS
jgi:hypothetical protein